MTRVGHVHDEEPAPAVGNVGAAVIDRHRLRVARRVDAAEKRRHHGGKGVDDLQAGGAGGDVRRSSRECYPFRRAAEPERARGRRGARVGDVDQKEAARSIGHRRDAVGDGDTGCVGISRRTLPSPFEGPGGRRLRRTAHVEDVDAVDDVRHNGAPTLDRDAEEIPGVSEQPLAAHDSRMRRVAHVRHLKPADSVGHEGVAAVHRDRRRGVGRGRPPQ